MQGRRRRASALPTCAVAGVGCGTDPGHHMFLATAWIPAPTTERGADRRLGPDYSPGESPPPESCDTGRYPGAASGVVSCRIPDTCDHTPDIPVSRCYRTRQELSPIPGPTPAHPSDLARSVGPQQGDAKVSVSHPGEDFQCRSGPAMGGPAAGDDSPTKRPTSLSTPGGPRRDGVA